MTETRSRNGCWTCKLRRKKCDERSPLCIRCESLNVTCYGFGERPEWMDSGVREKAELSSIKSVIAENLQYKRSRSVEQRPLTTPSPTAINLSCSPPSTPHRAQEITKEISDFGESVNREKFPSWSERHVDKFVLYNSTQQDGSQLAGSIYGPEMQHSWSSMTLEDAVLMMRFFEHAPRRYSPFSCISFCGSDPGRYLWFVSKSQCLYLTTLALEAYHERLSASDQGLKASDEYIIRYGLAVAELQRSVEDIHEPVLGYGETEVDASCILTCMLLLTEFNASNGDPEWQIHLQGASAMLSRYFSGKDGLRVLQKTLSGSNSAPTLDLTNLIGWVLWYDILSNISLGSRLCLWQRYLTILGFETVALNLEYITGCQNWPLVLILKIYALMDWKKQVQTTNQLNMWELVQKAGVIQQTLNAGIAATFQTLLQHGIGESDAWRSSRWLESEVRCVTYIFACTAAILLEVVVSGANPALPQIQQHVGRIVTVLAALPNHRLLLALSWPLCISGCMAEPVYYQFLITLLSPFDSTNQGGISNVLPVLRECWRMREESGNETHVDWQDAMRSLGTEILFA